MLIQTILNKDSPRLMFSLLVDLQNYFIIILFLIILEEVNLSSIKILGIDAGGTFTDFVLIEIGTSISLRIHKSLSTPSAPEQAILDGIRDLQLEQEVAAGGLSIIHGSTVATNAVLEGKVAKTVFVTNKGFAASVATSFNVCVVQYSILFSINCKSVVPVGGGCMTAANGK